MDCRRCYPHEAESAPKSPLPGNGISWAETKAPRRARRIEDALRALLPKTPCGEPRAHRWDAPGAQGTHPGTRYMDASPRAT
jgi:hypothetical protein